MEKLQQVRLEAIRFEDLEEEIIEIAPAVELSEMSDVQDIPEMGASVGWNSCSTVTH